MNYISSSSETEDANDAEIKELLAKLKTVEVPTTDDATSPPQKKAEASTTVA